MNKIIEYFKKNDGYARMADLKRASFQTRDIAKLLNEGKILKVKPGLYRLAEMQPTSETSFIDVCNSISKGVICLVSALSYYDLSTVNPSEIHVAIPHESKAPKILYPPIKIYYFRNRFYSTGISEKNIPGGVLKIYNMEKTICDMFRYRKKLGEDLALEGLKNYLKRKEANIPQLMHYAEICRVKTIITPYLKGILG